VEQIVAVLKQAEVGVPVAELIRKVGISEQTFYRWKKQYVGLESDQVREMKHLQDENGRLKQLVAELSLDKTMLQDVLRKSGEALAAPAAGRLSARSVPGQRAACLSGITTDAGHLSLQEPPKGMDRTTCADPRDRAEPGPIWVQEDSGSVEA
jgi:putative transposase